MGTFNLFILALSILFSWTAMPAFSQQDATNGGLGGTAVLSDGKSVWPPKGENCKKYISCCEAMQKKYSDVGLFCQMEAVLINSDCTQSIEKVKQYSYERQYMLAGSCH
jgi:hypothetical protein